MALRHTTDANTDLRASSVLDCQSLCYKFPNSKTIFADVSLHTRKDEFVAVVGPTGTGKSTLLRVIAHLVPPTSGRVLLDGVEVCRPSSRVSLVHQSIATFPWMTALENVMVGRHVRTKSGLFGAIFRTASFKAEEAA
ncbi:MAG: ATP-binding cassette domain-containing protein, partial [Nitrososphaerota archaeon]|nr:ATP-binding cassette domain-containing protein [Nitrososphaerota archaeon]